jgi:hypothetical protein
MSEKQQAFVGDLVSFQGYQGEQGLGIVGWIDVRSNPPIAMVLSDGDGGQVPLHALRLELTQEQLIQAGREYMGWEQS